VLILKYRVLSLYPCSHRVLNESRSFIKLSLKNKENSRPTKTHEAESVRTLGSPPKLLLIAIKIFPEILLSECEVLGNREYFLQLKVLKELRWEVVERFIWLRIGSSSGPLYTRQQWMNFGFYKGHKGPVLRPRCIGLSQWARNLLIYFGSIKFREFIG
jgi:hypothetical protein